MPKIKMKQVKQVWHTYHSHCLAYQSTTEISLNLITAQKSMKRYISPFFLCPFQFCIFAHLHNTLFFPLLFLSQRVLNELSFLMCKNENNLAVQQLKQFFFCCQLKKHWLQPNVILDSQTFACGYRSSFKKLPSAYQNTVGHVLWFSQTSFCFLLMIYEIYRD